MPNLTCPRCRVAPPSIPDPHSHTSWVETRCWSCSNYRPCISCTHPACGLTVCLGDLKKALAPLPEKQKFSTETPPLVDNSMSDGTEL